MEWQDLWIIKSAGTRSKEMEKVVVGVLTSRRTSIMKKAPKEEKSILVLTKLNDGLSQLHSADDEALG